MTIDNCENVTEEKLADFLEENPGTARMIMEKALLACKAREAARKARAEARDGKVDPDNKGNVEKILSKYTDMIITINKEAIKDRADRRSQLRAVLSGSSADQDHTKFIEEQNKNNFGNKWLKIVDDVWRESLSRVYKNDHYIVVSIEDRKDAIKDLGNQAKGFIKGLLGDKNK